MSARKPYRGSCHCGFTHYIAFLTLPPSANPVSANPDNGTPTTRAYKCNCIICHKAGYFHLRTHHAPHDFMLLSPLDVKELADYTTGEHKLHWYFCKTCRVRCFIFMGEGEVVDVDLSELGVGGQGKEIGMTKVWRPKAEGWIDHDTGYWNVNALTLDQGQEELDLGEWTEKRVVIYEDMRFKKEEGRQDRP